MHQKLGIEFEVGKLQFDGADCVATVAGSYKKLSVDNHRDHANIYNESDTHSADIVLTVLMIIVIIYLIL